MDRSLLSDVANDFHEFNKKQFSLNCTQGGQKG
jgi:hypothetical protein